MAETNELKRGVGFFRFVGKVATDPAGFKGLQEAKKQGGWMSVRDVLTLSIDEATKVFPVIQDGLMASNPKLIRFRKDVGSGGDNRLDIPFNEREAYVDKVNGTLKARIVHGEDGKLVDKEFIHGADLSNYLKAHLKQGTEVTVIGNVHYNYYNESVRREYHITGVYLNEPYMRNGEEVQGAPHTAQLTQTYLVNADSFPRNFESELQDGRTTLDVFVPEYVGKLHVGESRYVDVKKVLALPEKLVIKAENDEQYKKCLGFLKLLKKKVGKKALHIGLINDVYDGAQTETQDVKVSQEIQDLIDLGIISEDEVKSQNRVKRGASISDVIYNQIRVVNNDAGEAVADIEEVNPDLLVFNPEEYQSSDSGTSTTTENGSLSDADADDLENMFDAGLKSSSTKSEEKEDTTDDVFGDFFSDDDLPF